MFQERDVLELNPGPHLAWDPFHFPKLAAERTGAQRG